MFPFYRRLTIFILIFASYASASIDTYHFNSNSDQERFITLTHELRCPQCQNQSIGDSNSPIANDLRAEVFRLLNDEKSDEEIIAFMVDRYGEYIHYRPQFNEKTAALWLFPILLFIMGLAFLLGTLRKHRISSLQPDNLVNNTPNNDKKAP
ncbi:Cytochrome c-type biogenesis protein CcmH [invertebrate metagenome]|uniref:Cytochrome c-type biogenesis protein CcmH n=1 Tax=invertebrate metagenome TaxID=1711999 RepID=A0A2H9T9T0_9ZZZZ